MKLVLLMLLPLLLVLVRIGTCSVSPSPGSGAVRVLSPPGRTVHLRCLYKFEDEELQTLLSVQWKDPSKNLLCHYIKHKQYKQCSIGYDLSYQPANITLTIQHVRDQDFGVHLCSVNKPHNFTDHSVELARRTALEPSAPSSPNSGWKLSEGIVTVAKEVAPSPHEEEEEEEEEEEFCFYTTYAAHTLFGHL